MTVEVLVDADACPVKDEIYKVAFRYGAPVRLFANSPMRVPDHPSITLTVVSDGFDAADDAIAEAAHARAAVVTADILLADRCLKAGARVVAPNGKPFTVDGIGSAIAARAIMQDLRAGADGLDGRGGGGGPPPFTKQDRSRFLSTLDETLVRLNRA
ncbi:MAG: YaiI/YqxD family protein [Pseudomonadota bacterium]